MSCMKQLQLLAVRKVPMIIKSRYHLLNVFLVTLGKSTEFVGATRKIEQCC